MNFASDNTAGAHPAILEAMTACNEGIEPSYGDDVWSGRMSEALARWFDHEVFVYPVATGGAANALALSQIAEPYSAIFCLEGSHIDMDECGAPEFFTGGAKLVKAGPMGRLYTADDLRAALAWHPRGVVHHVQPGAVSITQATECGMVYGRDQIAAIAQVAHDAGMKLHMDGARLANALAHLGCAPADVTWRAGVDVLSLGFTKNGAVAAEAVVFFNKALADGFQYRRKRGGHLFSKSRFLAAQFLAMLNNDLWLDLAAHANGAATALAEAFAQAGYVADYPVQANEVFVRLPASVAQALKDAGARFYPWDESGAGPVLYRFVCSFRTAPDEIAFIKNVIK